MVQNDKTTIQVTKELKDYLDSQASKKGETYDQILRRLLTKLGIKFSDGGKIDEEAKEDVSH